MRAAYAKCRAMGSAIAVDARAVSADPNRLRRSPIGRHGKSRYAPTAIVELLVVEPEREYGSFGHLIGCKARDTCVVTNARDCIGIIAFIALQPDARDA